MTEHRGREVESVAQLMSADTPPPLMNPNMAGYHRQQVCKLRDASDRPDKRTGAVDILREPVDLHDHLAGILSLANKTKGGSGEWIAEKCTAVVAGENASFCAHFVATSLEQVSHHHSE